MMVAVLRMGLMMNFSQFGLALTMDFSRLGPACSGDVYDDVGVCTDYDVVDVCIDDDEVDDGIGMGTSKYAWHRWLAVDDGVVVGISCRC